MKSKIHRIVLTGGPCGGKTTVLVAMAEHFEEAGFKVIVAFEAATALILNRMSLNVLGQRLFQEQLLSFAIVQAEHAEQTAAMLAEESGKSVVIIFDRTWLDGKAYTSPDEWPRLVEKHRPFERTSPSNWGIVHLVTAADGAEPFYTLGNNMARYETAEQARARDGQLVDAYQHLEHRFRIGNEGSFERKVHRAVAAACRFVGIPEPLEIERWFDVKSVDRAALDACNPVRVEIYQFYAPDGKRYRRRKLPDGELTFSVTRKEMLPGGDPGTRIEVSEMLTAFQFGEALDRHRGSPFIMKVRWVFDHGHYRWELDEFENPPGRVKLEVETPTAGETVTVPGFIEVRGEVTDDPRWSNFSLAQSR